MNCKGLTTLKKSKSEGEKKGKGKGKVKKLRLLSCAELELLKNEIFI